MAWATIFFSFVVFCMSLLMHGQNLNVNLTSWNFIKLWSWPCPFDLMFSRIMLSRIIVWVFDVFFYLPVVILKEGVIWYLVNLQKALQALFTPNMFELAFACVF